MDKTANVFWCVYVYFISFIAGMWMTALIEDYKESNDDYYYTVEFWCDRYEWAEMLYNEDWSMSDTCYKDGAFYNLNVGNHEK